MPESRTIEGQGVATPAWSAIRGVGAYRPRRVVENDEIAGPIGSSDQWIRQRSGIVSRRFASAEETIEMMSAEAVTAALADASLDVADVDCLIVATSTRLVFTPACAPAIVASLGAGPIAAFDLSAGCAGFCHGIAIASDLVRGGTSSVVAVVGVEKLSDTIDMTDRATAFLFADGAGAVIVGRSETPGIGPTVWGSEGHRASAIGQTKNWLEYFDDVDAYGRDAVRPYLAMDGAQVFRWATSSLESTCRSAIKAAGLAPEDLDALIAHQANARITEVLATVLGVSSTCVVADDIAISGNTSAASVPLALDAVASTGSVPPGGRALLVAFGAGLSFAAQVVVLPGAN